MVYYEEILDKYKNLSKDKQIVKFFEIVRDIPYGLYTPISPENTWRHKKGTCSTKNLILKDLYLAIGVPVRVWMCSFAFYPSEKFTDEMNGLLDPPIIVHHTFLKIELDGKWIIADATHDLFLKTFGFNVVENWDGKSDTLLAVKAIDYFKVDDVNEFKHKIDSQLSQDERMRKRHFLELFFEWIDGLRKKN